MGRARNFIEQIGKSLETFGSLSKKLAHWLSSVTTEGKANYDEYLISILMEHGKRLITLGNEVTEKTGAALAKLESLDKIYPPLPQKSKE